MLSYVGLGKTQASVQLTEEDVVMAMRNFKALTFWPRRVIKR